MLPFPYFKLAQAIHQERIRAAERKRPEWMYSDAFLLKESTRPSREHGRLLRALLAQTLRQFAAVIDPARCAAAVSDQSTAAQ